jgi:protocatechuate 3,4-dioxygenase beta subunit
MLAGASAMGQVIEAACRRTPAQTEGPFYPVKDQPDKDNDLTLVRGRTEHARGQVILVRGLVTDEECRPIERALVEIWQACASGRYNHPGDDNPAPLDPDFQYWGRALTDGDGRYEFRTILPGAYPADTDWTRPPHIHFKVHRKGYHELTTQMYFEGEALNDRDRILMSLPAGDREAVIVRLEDVAEPGVKACRFDLGLRKV